MERRFNQQPVQVRQGDKPGIWGYAAVFYREGDPGTEYVIFDDLVERVMPGCFDRAMKEDDCLGLFNHNRDLLLGRMGAGTVKLTVDNVGLRYDIDTPDTQVGRDVLTYLTRGDVAGSSFSFKARAVTWRDQGKMTYRELRDVSLGDVGPVTRPAYRATTAGVRSEGAELEGLRAELAAWKAQRPVQAPAPLDTLRMRQRLAELDQ